MTPPVQDKFARLAALKPVRSLPRQPVPLRAPNEEDTLSRILGAGVATNRYGEHISIRNWFSSPEFVAPSATTLELLSHGRDKSLSKRTRATLADPEKWLFLDTETTGLAGGTGTYAFLVGIAWWDAGGLQAEQFFMRDFGEEHSILSELAARLAERPVLVTFNGKSFDWPLLENRFTMTRAVAAPRLAAHLDLLHPSRALWKLRLPSVRLVDLERHVLDATKLAWHREDDVLSSLIPQHYFDYLRGGPPEPLAAVVRHNQMDLRGLAALVEKIDALLSLEAPASDDIDGLDLFGLSRFLHRRGEPDRAHTACSQALQAGLPSEFSPQARRQLAQLAKRRGCHDDAARLWHEVVLEASADHHDIIHACEQLAIYYERQGRNLPRAVEFTQLALAKLRRLPVRLRDPLATTRAMRIEHKLLLRLARLEHKIARKHLASPAPPLLRAAAGRASH